MRMLLLTCILTAVAIIAVAVGHAMEDKSNHVNISDKMIKRLGVIETSEEGSIITIYNTNSHEEIKKIRCEYMITDMCDIESESKIHNITNKSNRYVNDIYAIVREKTSMKRQSLIRINLDNGKQESVLLEGEGYMALFCKDEYIYTINTVLELEKNETKTKSYISRFDRNMKLLNKSFIGNLVLDNINMAEGHLLITGFDYANSNTVHSELITIDKCELDVIDRIDISEHGMSYNGAIVLNERVYLTAGSRWNKLHNIEEVNDYSTVINKDKSISEIYTGNASRMYSYRDRIIAINYKTSLDSGNIVTEYYPKNNTCKKRILNDILRDTVVNDNILYTLGHEQIYAYNIDNNLEMEYYVKLTHNIEDTGLFTKIFIY